MSVVQQILGEAVRPPDAYELADPYYAYYYAKDDLLGQPFPAGEDAIATSEYYSYKYAVNVLRKRFHKCEAMMAKSDTVWTDKYAVRFPEVRLEWALKGWTDWFEV